MPNTPHNFDECKHNEIGHKVIGGFPGHEHIHPSGPLFCFKCEKTLKQIVNEAYERGKRDGIEEEAIKCYDHNNQARTDERRKVADEAVGILEGMKTYEGYDVNHPIHGEDNKKSLHENRLYNSALTSAATEIKKLIK